MRSKLGTQSRLAAHILAFVLLILMLVYTAPEKRGPEPQPAPMKPSVSVHLAKAAPETPPAPPGEGTLDRVHTPAVATRVDREELRPPADPSSPRPERAPVEAPGIAAEPPGHSGTLDNAAELRPHQEPLRPPAEEPAAPAAPETEREHDNEAEATVSSGEGTVTGLVPEEGPPVAEENDHPGQDGDAHEAAAVQPSETAGEAEKAEDIAAPEPEGFVSPEAENGAPEDIGEARPALPQPDESGALVVAPSETGASGPVAAATPLPNANLEVLGDGVYWLDPRHDLETELAAVPELRSLILLTPLPGVRVQGFEHVKTETIPADPADLTADAAERFIHLTDGANRPAVVAVQPGTRGAAFFKGAYLLRNRNMSEEDMLREIAPELNDAGEARDDIIHRLMRLKGTSRGTLEK